MPAELIQRFEDALPIGRELDLEFARRRQERHHHAVGERGHEVLRDRARLLRPFGPDVHVVEHENHELAGVVHGVAGDVGVAGRNGRGARLVVDFGERRNRTRDAAVVELEVGGRETRDRIAVGVGDHGIDPDELRGRAKHRLLRPGRGPRSHERDAEQSDPDRPPHRHTTSTKGAGGDIVRHEETSTTNTDSVVLRALLDSPHASAAGASPLLARLYDRSRASQWGLARDAFAAAVEASVARAFAGRSPTPRDLDRYLDSLHAEDLALAAACAAGSEAAWEHFVLEHRPALRRAGQAIDPNGGSELADSLLAELFGVNARGGERPSLFRYFHGRSALDTWLRAVLAQRHVDGLRAGRRLVALPDDAHELAGAAGDPPDPAREPLAAAVRDALAAAFAGLDPRDRLRLRAYYLQRLTLAAIGRLLHEHESTVSRQLARTRRQIREVVEASLRRSGLDDRTIAECFESVQDQDVGGGNVVGWLTPVPDRKIDVPDRSK